MCLFVRVFASEGPSLFMCVYVCVCVILCMSVSLVCVCVFLCMSGRVSVYECASVCV